MSLTHICTESELNGQTRNPIQESLLSVLYVDDEQALLDLTKFYLERRGDILVTSVTSAKRALELVETSFFDVIISDYQMPDMDGIELLKSLQTKNNTIPFILFTGKGREEVVIEAINNGATFYIQKGGDPRAQFAELEHKIKEAARRRQAEEEVKESEKRYRNVVEDQTEFISRFLPDGTHVFVNDAYCRYFHKSRDEIIGKRFAPEIPREDKNLVKEHFDSLTKEHPVSIVTHRIIMPDGDVRWQRWSDRAIFEKNGILVEYQSVGRDVTENKKAEQALQESEAKYRTIFENTGTAGVLLEDNTFISLANAEFECLSGYSKTEIEGKKSWMEFVVKDDLGPMFAQHRLTHEHPEAAKKNYEFRFVTRSGEIRNIFLTISMIPGSTKSVASLIDVTERKQVVEELKMKSEELKAAYEQLAALEDELIHSCEKLIKARRDPVQDQKNTSNRAGEIVPHYRKEGKKNLHSSSFG